MVEQKPCQGCNQRHECQDIYQKMANFKGPSFVFQVIIAFLLPILVFIASLAAFERILTKLIIARQLQTALSFLLALPITLGPLLIKKMMNRQFSENK